MHHALIAIAGNLVLRGERTKRKREGKEEEKDGQLADEAQRLYVGNLTELASAHRYRESSSTYILPYINTTECFLFNDIYIHH